MSVRIVRVAKWVGSAYPTVVFGIRRELVGTHSRTHRSSTPDRKAACKVPN